jgi:hypothetical protein
MPRTSPTIAAALAALAIAAPAASATPTDPRQLDMHASTVHKPAAPQQDLRSPDAQDAARPTPPADITAALAQERYYSSYGEPEPITPPASAPTADTGDGIAPLPFMLGLVGALIVGLAAGSGLHQLHVRRRHATGLAT